MRFTHTIFFFFFTSFIFAQKKTIVAGLVVDARTQEPLEYVNVQFREGTLGVSTDNYGRFLIETNENAIKVKVSYVGYVSQTIEIKNGERNEIKVLLKDAEAVLTEVLVKPKKYKKKNPATDLVKEMFARKDLNRKEGLPYYQYDTYEKLRFELNGVTDHFTQKWYFKPWRFAFKYCDTNKVNQKVTFPFYLRERLMTTYLRRDPFAKRDKLWAERQSAFEDDYELDKDGISSLLTSMFSDIDIYSPTIRLLDKQFVAPLSPVATNFYRFYITDTVSYDKDRYVSLFFAPFVKSDLAFIGTMLVSLDGKYAVKKVDMSVAKGVNINWVKDMKISQEFDFQGDSINRRLYLRRDDLAFDFKIFKHKDGRSLLVTKKDDFTKRIINLPQNDTLYVGKTELIRDTGKIERTIPYWVENRPEPIPEKDANITTMMDTIKSMKITKRVIAFGSFMESGELNLKYVRLGSLGSLYRFNDVEGNRWQIGIRSSNKYAKKYRIRGYAAYGTKDQKWKYGGNATLAFKGARPGRYPLNQARISYENDLFFPGLNVNTNQNLLNSAQVGVTNRLLRNRIVKIEYFKENKQGIMFSLTANRKAVNEVGLIDELGQNINNQQVVTEVGSWIRYSPNAKFYQGREVRTSIKSKYPIFDLYLKAGLKNIFGGQYAFQKASGRVEKNFYIAPFGKSRWVLEGGQIFGQVPYQFLEIHRANRSAFFEDEGFNMMNYLEFVSDRYATLHINHNFEGVLFNRIPLLKRLRWREGISFKALYGILSDKNIPSDKNGLVPFPLNLEKQPITQRLGKLPYMEFGAGVGNIFGFMRIEYIKRLTYLNLPNVQKDGIKVMFSAEF